MLVLRLLNSLLFGSGITSGAIAGWINGRFAHASDAWPLELLSLLLALALFVGSSVVALRRAVRLVRISGYAVARFQRRLHRSVEMTKADRVIGASPALRLR